MLGVQVSGASSSGVKREETHMSSSRGHRVPPAPEGGGAGGAADLPGGYARRPASQESLPARPCVCGLGRGLDTGYRCRPPGSCQRGLLLGFFL